MLKINDLTGSHRSEVGQTIAFGRLSPSSRLKIIVVLRGMSDNETPRAGYHQAGSLPQFSQAISLAISLRHYQNRYPNPTDGSARCVVRSMPFSPGKSYVGELYTRPRYSARMKMCFERLKSAPPP